MLGFTRLTANQKRRRRKRSLKRLTHLNDGQTPKKTSTKKETPDGKRHTNPSSKRIGRDRR
jgi:hypothetical protein